MMLRSVLTKAGRKDEERLDDGVDQLGLSLIENSDNFQELQARSRKVFFKRGFTVSW